MPGYKVIWQMKAWMQLIGIEDYLLIFSDEAGQKVVNKILKDSAKLEINPFIGQIEEMLKGYPFEYRYKVSGHYKLLYRIENTKVYIIAVFDTRQDPGKMLKMIE